MYRSRGLKKQLWFDGIAAKSELAKRKPLVNIEKDEAENGFSMHVLHERPRQGKTSPTFRLSELLKVFCKRNNGLRR
jgi:hypothetical protein